MAKGSVRGAALLALAVVLSPGCRVFRAEEWERRDQCARSLPVLRAEPKRPYRVLGVVDADTEEDLAWQACREGGDAILTAGVTSKFLRGERLRAYVVKYTD